MRQFLARSDFQPARVLRYQAKVVAKRHDSVRALALLPEAEDVLIGLELMPDRAALALSLLYINQAKIAFKVQQREPARSVGLASLDHCQRAGGYGHGYLPGVCVDIADILYEYGEQQMARQLWQRAAGFNSALAEAASVATALARSAYLAAQRGEKEAALKQIRRALDISLQPRLLRYHRLLGEWLSLYEKYAKVGPLLDLARLED